MTEWNRNDKGGLGGKKSLMCIRKKGEKDGMTEDDSFIIYQNQGWGNLKFLILRT